MNLHRRYLNFKTEIMIQIDLKRSTTAVNFESFREI